MTTLTISRPTGAFSEFLRELGRALASIAAGRPRRARVPGAEQPHGCGAGAREGIARNDTSRVVFERNFA